MDAVRRGDGFTFNPATDSFVEVGDPYYIVSYPDGGLVVDADSVDAFLIRWFVNKHRPYITGGWAHEGKYYLDKCFAVKDKETALYLGKRWGQTAIWDANTGQNIFLNEDKVAV